MPEPTSVDKETAITRERLAEIARLARAARGLVLGIEEDDDHLAAQVGGGDGLAVAGGKGEFRSAIADAEHVGPFDASRRKTVPVGCRFG